MKKSTLILLAALVAGAVLISQIQSTENNVLTASTPEPIKKYSLSISDKNILVELADTPEKKALGLGERDSLPKEEGMLFIYEQKTPSVFWMKGMRFPLDIIWIADGKVAQIDANVPHEPGVSDYNLKRYISNQPVDSVLEVNAGFAEEHNIQIGDTVTLR